MGWQGVVVSDDLQMKAITDVYGFDEAVRRVVDAGVDVLLVCNNLAWEPDAAPRIVELLARRVRSGQPSAFASRP